MQADARYANIVSNLLGRIVVVDDINEASRVARDLGYHNKVVTLDGVSLPNWEMKWHVPFFGNDSLTREQMVDYVRCMTVTQGVEPGVYLRLTESNMAAIYKYMDEPMTATWFPGEPKPCEPRIPQKSKPRPKIKVKVKALTSEAIYARMFAAHIPLECEKWHAISI